VIDLRRCAGSAVLHLVYRAYGQANQEQAKFEADRP
jgi:hypothetical protein